MTALIFAYLAGLLTIPAAGWLALRWIEPPRTTFAKRMAGELE